MASDGLDQLLGRVDASLDFDALDALEEALASEGAPSDAELERLHGVLDRVREATDPGIRSRPRVEPVPVGPPERGAWGLFVGLAAAAAMLVVVSAGPAFGPTEVRYRGAGDTPGWSMVAQEALEGCCRADEPVRARLHVDAHGRVRQVELLGSPASADTALRSLARLPVAPTELWGEAVDIWLQ